MTTTIESENETMKAVDRNLPVPLYHQFAEYIKHKILAGEYKQNDKLPAESEIISAYKISQPTVRQALNQLVKEGLLIRERGRGTFVRPLTFSNDSRKKQSSVTHKRIALMMPWGAGTFFAPLLSSIEDTAHQGGFQVLVVNNKEDAQMEIIKSRELLRNGIDGLLWMCPSGGPNLAFARHMVETLPAIVAIDRKVDIEGCQVNLVTADNYGGMRSLVNYLLKKGHRNIAFVTESQRISSALDREGGYHAAMKEAGMDSSEWVFRTRKTEQENGRLCAEKLLSSGKSFDAIVCVNDQVAVGVIHGLQEKGVRVSEDIAVAGFGDEPVCEVVSPKLTTVHMNVAEMGRLAMDLLMSQLNEMDESFVETKTIIMPVELVVRGSA